MRFTWKWLIKRLSWLIWMTFFRRFEKRYKHFFCHNIFFSSFQCECDISKIINFCFIWIAYELCFNNERINSTKLFVMFSSYVLSIFWICIRAIITWLNSKIIILFNIIIFHSLIFTFNICWTNKNAFEKFSFAKSFMFFFWIWFLHYCLNRIDANMIFQRIDL